MSSTVLGSFRRAREWAYPQLTSSAFLEKGVLTPEEFIIAGDELVFRCPTWEWSSASSNEKSKSYLPSNKQYLITRNVPCQNRVSSLETNLNMRYEKGDNGDNSDNANKDDDIDEWMISSILATKDDNENENDGNEDNIEDDFDILDEDGEIVEKTKALGLQDEDKKGIDPTVAVTAVAEATKTDVNDEYDDMDDYEDDDILVDEDAAATPTTNATTTTANSTTTSSSKSNILKTRTYDLSITYDKYYQVPRVWMVGRSETNQPLTSSQMMEDVISDYAYKTVTIEIHPHITSSCPHASIHPCQHAKVMKAIIKNLVKGSSNKKKSDDDDGNEQADEQHQHQQQGPSVETYLFIFLKFVSSMIPTINYDFTMEVTADTSK